MLCLLVPLMEIELRSGKSIMFSSLIMNGDFDVFRSIGQPVARDSDRKTPLSSNVAAPVGASSSSITSISHLVPGRRSFVGDGSQGNGVCSWVWSQAVTFIRPSILLMISSWELTAGMVAPGVFPGRDVFVQETGELYRVAVASLVARDSDWQVFRCFVYPDVAGMELSRRVGYICAPLIVVEREQMLKVVAEKESNLDVQKCIQSVSSPMRRFVRLRFPVPDEILSRGVY